MADCGNGGDRRKGQGQGRGRGRGRGRGQTPSQVAGKARGRGRGGPSHYHTRQHGLHQDDQSRSSSQQNSRGTRGDDSARQSSSIDRSASEQPSRNQSYPNTRSQQRTLEPVIPIPPIDTRPSGTRRQHISQPVSTSSQTIPLETATAGATPAITLPQSSPVSTTLTVRDPPPRPGFGTKGRPIQLRANHFKIDIPRGNIYHYDVNIQPGKCPRHINRQVIKQIETKHKDKLAECKLAYDGVANLYTSKPLPSVNGQSRSELKVTIQIEREKEREFTVSLKLVATVSLDVLHQLSSMKTTTLDQTQSAINAIDVILRWIPSLRYTSVGRSFFTQPRATECTPLGGGREVWYGYYQSVRPAMWSMTLNLDLSATAFYKEQSVLDFLTEIVSGGRGGGGGRGREGSRGRDRYRDGQGGARGGGFESNTPSSLSDSDRRQFAKEIKGLKVEVTHLSYPRKYKVKDVTREPATKLSFDFEGRQCTVQNYFKEMHKKPLSYPNLPCLHMDGKNPSIYIPLEFCKILGQNCTRKLTGDQTSEMIKATARPAYEREREIRERVREADFARDECLRDFGIKIHRDMMSIDGRVLDPPKLEYRDKKNVTPDRGQWDMRGNFFFKGINIKCWGIIVIPNQRFFNEDAVHTFARELSKASREKGMEMTNRPAKVYYIRYDEDLETVVRLFQQNISDLQLLVVILDGTRGISYNKVKRVCDNLVGVCTQCVQVKNAQKAHPSTMKNLCLKINSKLGGTNSVILNEFKLHVFEKPIMIMGADVTHPAPGDTRSPSLAALTASFDRHAMEYRAQVKVLKHRQEVFEIEQLAEMIKGMLLKFYLKYNKQYKPERIIFYRDGVSEGQFKKVIEQEIAAVQKACQDLESGYQPGITFLVVQKRHHTRLFCANREDQHGKGSNVPAGTTVDTHITHPTEFDFFLCSHAGIQGTSKPCHYHVLWDDNNFTADDLQTLTYQLCHCYVRCNRSVSYPAPTYYSHLAAFRARYTLQDWEERKSGSSDTASSVSYSSEDLVKVIPELQRAIEVNEHIKDTMYFV